MARRSSEDEYATLNEDEKLLLADLYPELKNKLERSIERSRKKRAPVRKAQPIPVFDISSDDDDDKIKKQIVEAEVQIPEDVADESRRSEEYSFHSAKSRVEQENASRSSDSISPPTSFRAEEQSGDEMEGSFVYNPRASSPSSFEDVEVDEQEPEGESLTEEDDRVRGDEEESVHSSDKEFIDDEEDPEMSIDQSFHADVVMETPPSKRVLPSRSTRNQQFTTNGRVLVPAAAKRAENPAAISPSMVSERRAEKESDDGSGEESFERYLRKVREEDERKKRQMEEEEDEEEEMEDSFFVSDESEDVINDEYENGSGEDEEEEGEWNDSSDSSSDDDKENRRTKKVNEEKPAKKRNLLLDLADTFNSPSVRAVDKDARDPDRHFLLSLSENYEGKRRHADAEAILKRGVRGEKTRTALVQRLFDMYNREIFEEKLPANLEITFNARLRKTAGYCKWSSRASKCTIELSPKVCSQPDRIRDTLAHEMCHAAVFVINKIMKGRHGPVWQHWARAFSSRFRGFPVPSRCHNYEIEAKFVYECDGCGQLIKRHSKSLDTEKKCCGKCHGRFHLREKTDANGKKREANGFALFVKDNYGEEKRSGRSHKEIMQLLSARFKQSKTVEGERQEEEEERDVKRLDLDLSVMSIHEEE